LYALPRCVPDPCVRRGTQARCAKVHQLTHDRARGTDRSRAPRGRRGLALRLRRLPRGLPLQPSDARGRRSGEAVRAGGALERARGRGVSRDRRRALPSLRGRVTAPARGCHAARPERGPRPRQPGRAAASSRARGCGAGRPVPGRSRGRPLGGGAHSRPDLRAPPGEIPAISRERLFRRSTL
jgi:hypothetical protein